MSYYHVKMTADMGRGMFANTDLREHQAVTRCEVLVLSQDDTAAVNRTELKHYTFAYDLQETSRPRDCLVLGDGEIFNHSDNANVGYRLEDIGDRKVMLFYALRPIKAGEQLFINYNDDVTDDVEIDGYLTSKSLI